MWEYQVQEIVNVLAKTFHIAPSSNDSPAGVLEMLNTIEDKKDLRFVVEKITLVHNTKRNAMYAMFKQEYGLGDGDEIDVVHGTNPDAVQKVCEEGIRGAPMAGHEMGNGIYVSRLVPCFWCLLRISACRELTPLKTAGTQPWQLRVRRRPGRRGCKTCSCARCSRDRR
tara:strand:+ start:585 stop:1091 length:507 start_codon:yes stop_codon:yes gene_type:complete